MDQVLSSPLPSAPRPLAFAVLRVPFLLEPDYDESAPHVESNRDRLIRKWGGVDGWERQKARHDLKGRGLDAGIPHFNLHRLASSSVASHRLVQHVAKRYGLRASEGLYDRLNVYYFVEGHSLNDRPRLASVASEELARLVPSAAELGDGTTTLPPPMSKDELLAFLDGDEGKDEVYAALRALQRMGVHGIPKFIVEGRTVVDGAARHDTFVRIFRDIERRGEVHDNGRPVFADILGIGQDIVLKGSHVGAMMTNTATTAAATFS